MLKHTIGILSRKADLAQTLPALLKGRFECLICDSVAGLNDALKSRRPSGFVADFEGMLNGGHTEDRLLDDLQRRFPEMPIVMITGEACPEPLERRAACGGITHLRGAVGSEHIAAVLRQRLVSDRPAQQKLDFEERLRWEDIPENSPADTSSLVHRFESNTPHLVKMLADLEVAARHDVTILLIGETGSGKTYLSRLIHEASPRRQEPFLHVACGALPSELIESELFGHVKGAFTSAHADKEGKFVAAGRGTVLLDEIDVLGLEQQVKLLRVIETGEFEAVGSNRTLKSQARVVVASNLDLVPLVEQGKFRPDLYYRLNMLRFEIPPLRSRRPDITPLARRFIRQLSARHKVEIKRVDPGLFEALHAYSWPGNVRELENVIQRTVIYCHDGVLTAEQLPPHILAGGPSVFVNGTSPVACGQSPAVRPAGPRLAEHEPSHLGDKIAMTEREIIEQALFRNSFSRTNTAKHLGISRVTLYNKMKKYGMTK
jgi:DNA-binding NtrC family response regulator